MKTGFSIMRRDSVWILKMAGVSTEGKFGSLGAAMRCAYLLANAEIDDGTDGQADSLAEIA